MCSFHRLCLLWGQSSIFSSGLYMMAPSRWRSSWDVNMAFQNPTCTSSPSPPAKNIHFPLLSAIGFNLIDSKTLKIHARIIYNSLSGLFCRPTSSRIFPSDNAGPLLYSFINHLLFLKSEKVLREAGEMCFGVEWRFLVTTDYYVMYERNLKTGPIYSKISRWWLRQLTSTEYGYCIQEQQNLVTIG